VKGVAPEVHERILSGTRWQCRISLFLRYKTLDATASHEILFNFNFTVLNITYLLIYLLTLSMENMVDRAE
jgi:hypothetical protein